MNTNNTFNGRWSSGRRQRAKRLEQNVMSTYNSMSPKDRQRYLNYSTFQ